jgi:uncharacterized membrane protein
MSKGRLEAFSDGVIAILITIMVLELTPPHEPQVLALVPLLPTFVSYLLSFLMLGIYWNNHHHMLQTVKHVNGRVLWANLHLLFWLSLIPFGTAWIGETNFAATPVSIYGVVLLLAAIAYYLLTHALLGLHDRTSVLATAVGRDAKGSVSILIYALAIPAAFAIPWVAYLAYVLVALMWLVPDRRIEKVFTVGVEHR